MNIVTLSKVCYLHVGLHKTASSSFQATCAKNKDLLQKSGLIYPIFSCEVAKKKRIKNHSFPIKSLFTENPADFGHNKKWGVSGDIDEVNSSYESQLTSYLASAGNLIISGEEISKLSSNEMRKFRDKIKSYDYKIKVVALVRSPYEAICSAIQQQIKGGSYIKLISLNDCVPNSYETPRFRKLRILKNIESVFGEALSLYSFDHACASSYGPVGFLLKKFLGQNPAKFKYVRTNESMSNLSVRISNEFNKINPCFVDGEYNRKFQKFPLSLDKELSFSGKFLLTELEYELVEEQIKDEIRGLIASFGLDFSDSLLKFSPPIF